MPDSSQSIPVIRMQDVNPFIRFAQIIQYYGNGKPLYAADVRILYILDGHGTLELQGSRHTLAENMLFLIQPGECYRFAAGTAIRMLAVNFDLDWRRSDVTQVLATANSEDTLPVQPCALWIDDCPLLCGPVVLQDGSRYREMLVEVTHVFTRQKLYYWEEGACVLKHVLISIARSADTPSPRANRMIHNLIEYVHQHYNENITMEMLESRFSYNGYHLNRLMRKFTGTTIHRYILNYRITMARKLLAESDEPVGNIAREVGFVNFAYFSKYFSAATGYTPSAYRSLLTGGGQQNMMPESKES